MKILRQGWNVCYGNKKNLQNKSNKGKKNSSDCDFQSFHGHLHTLMTFGHMINTEFVTGHFYHCMSRSDARETCVAGCQ